MQNQCDTQHLIDLGHILSKHNVSWWLQDGALLGLHRDGKLLEHDHDIDVGVEAKSFSAHALVELLADGYNLLRTYGAAGCFEITLCKDRTFIDLFFYYPMGKGQWYHSCFYDPDRAEFERYDYLHTRFIPVKRDYGFGEVYVPKNANKFLQEKYGAWQEPVKGWRYWKDPENVHPIREVHSHDQSWINFWKWINSLLQDRLE